MIWMSRENTADIPHHHYTRDSKEKGTKKDNDYEEEPRKLDKHRGEHRT